MSLDNHRSRVRKLGRLAFAGLAAACLLGMTTPGAGANSAATVSGHEPRIDVPATLPLRLHPDQVAAIVAQHLPDASLDRISARRWLSQVHSLEPNVGMPPFGRDAGPVWIVRAHGSFVGRHVPPGQTPVVANTGYFLIADSTGAIFAMGMP